MITREIFECHLLCSYKAFLRTTDNHPPGTPNQYAQLSTDLEIEYRKNVLRDVFHSFVEEQQHVSVDTLKCGRSTIAGAVISTNQATVSIDVLEKSRGTSALGRFFYRPTITSRRTSVSRNDKLVLGLLGKQLAEIQGKEPDYGSIIHGPTRSRLRIDIAAHIGKAKEILGELVDRKHSPEPFLNEHCKQCEYQTHCLRKALNKDDLSLLSRISPKEVAALKKRGIFTVTQLSHTFRPTRKYETTDYKSRPRSYALQALSIREQKVHIYNCPPIPRAKTQIFLDVESDPDDDFFYLIGAQVVCEGSSTLHQFWADKREDQAAIFKSFLSLLSSLKDFKMFHFGSFESKFLMVMFKRCALETTQQAERLHESTVNVVSYLYSSIYFPTYSNDLKTLGSFLGHRWREPGASGLQSVVWRKEWERDPSPERKDVLLAYNSDDCGALKLVTETIQLMTAPVDEQSSKPGTTVVDAGTLKKRRPRSWGKIEFSFPEMDEINRRAYYDYQKDRVYARDSRRPRKSLRVRSKPAPPPRYQVNKTVSITCRRCRNCKTNDIQKIDEETRIVIDLKFSPGGVRRWIVKQLAHVYRCNACNSEFASERFWAQRRAGRKPKYGHALLSWVIYQNIVKNQSFGMIADSLREVFSIHIRPNILHEFKRRALLLYSKTYKQLVRHAFQSNFLVADEAKIKLYDASGFAWVFANTDVVVFIYKDTREGEFLEALFKNFTGVIVSDFYAAYDGLKCRQQKCLIHLMRDLNEDLTKNPFDAELRGIARAFTDLLRAIVGTIDEFGLKRRRLRLHLPSIKKFLKEIRRTSYSSDNALKYQKRIAKNSDKLFTFINCNGVPWNNNAAEHAIKHLAQLRRKGIGSFTKARIDEYMQLVSIYQTCEYRGLSFLKFLLSGAVRLAER